MLGKRNVRFLSILFLGILFVSQVYSQTITYDETEDTDVGLRLSAEISKRLSRNWSISLEEELRLNDNISRFDRLYSSVSVGYTINPYILIRVLAINIG